MKFTLLLPAVLLAGLATGGAAGSESTTVSLKSAFAGDFRVGVAMNRYQVLGDDAGLLEFAAGQFNALTNENELKWEKVQPEEGRFDWTGADALVRYARDNGMHITGHVLIWHNQTPGWVFDDGNGNPASRELLLRRMEGHISAVVGRYRGVIGSWDVVNEALNDDGTLRETPWLNIIGEDYLERAFEFAHRADPGAKLIYNDYSLYKPAKRDGAVRLVRHLQEKGVPVHEVGMQAHYGLGHPEDWRDFEGSILAFAALGVQVAITELDISVLPFPDEQSRGADLSVDHELNARLNPYSQGLPADVENAWNQRYLDLFGILLANREKISRVTFWGVNDGWNWKNNWPVRGRTDYPLLFDRASQPKPVVKDLIELGDPL